MTQFVLSGCSTATMSAMHQGLCRRVQTTVSSFQRQHLEELCGPQNTEVVSKVTVAVG